MDAILGPPWRRVAPMPPAVLAADPPTVVACGAIAAMSPVLGRLERCGTDAEARVRAQLLAARGDGIAYVFKGAMQLTSGRWYWPGPGEAVEVSKQLDPLDLADMGLISEKLRRSLLRAARGDEALAMRMALDQLDVDWSELSPEGQLEIFGATRDVAAAAGVGAGIATATRRIPALTTRIAGQSRRANILGIRPSLALQDRSAMRALGRSVPFFIRGDYGRRADAWATKDAQRVLRAGLGRGLSDRVIGRDLHSALGARLTARSPTYFSWVASTVLGRARSFGQLTGYRDAGVKAYEWSAAMDEATCFAAGTLVRTPDGEKPIENVRPGDAVLSSRGVPRVVTATRVVPRRDWLRVRLSNGRVMRVTLEHPILSEAGWVRARALRSGDLVASGTDGEALRGLWRGDTRSAPVLRVVRNGDAGMFDVQAFLHDASYLGGARRFSLLGGVSAQTSQAAVPPLRQDFSWRSEATPLLGSLSASAVYPELHRLREDEASPSVTGGVGAVLLGSLLPKASRRDGPRSVGASGAHGCGHTVRARGEDRTVVGGLPATRQNRTGGRRGLLALPRSGQASGRSPGEARLRGSSFARGGRAPRPELRAARLEGLWPRPSETLDVEFVRVERVDYELTRPAPAYDLQVEADAGYVAAGVVVHNCNICAFLHGQRIPVDRAIGAFERAQANPDPERGLMEEMAFYREFDGGIHVAPEERGGDVGPLVAEVLESAVGIPDVAGSFRQEREPGTDRATPMPPAHPHCRCTTVPIL